MPKAKVPIYEYKEKVNGKTRYYIRPYVKDIYGNIRQIKRRVDDSGNMWIGKEGYNLALEELKKYQIDTINNNIATNITFEDLFKEYLKSKKNKIRSGSFELIKNRTELHILPKFGKIKIININTKNFKEWQDEMIEKTYTRNKKVNKYSHHFLTELHSYFSAVLDYGILEYGLTVNVAKIVKNFKNNNPTPKHYDTIDYEEYLRLMSATEKSIKYNTLFDVFFSLGTRPGELMALKWDSFNEDKKCLGIKGTLSKKQKGKRRTVGPTKTPSSYRVLDIDDMLLEKLKKLKEYWQQFIDFNEEWYIFSGPHPISENAICSARNKYFKLAGINKHIRLHDFRHSNASWLHSLNLPIGVISAKLGHANVEETYKTYIHLFKSNSEEATNLINKLKKQAQNKPRSKKTK